MNKKEVLEKTEKWLKDIVIGLNLCPFAKRPFVKGGIRIEYSDAESGEELTRHLLEELNLLNIDAEIETTLLVHPHFLQDFEDYLSFVDFTQDILIETGLEGEIQIASFHPDYYFDGVAVDDIGNYTNRSPFPMLHLIREDSISEAVASYPDIEEVPTNNIKTMEELGFKRIKMMWEDL